MSIAIHYTKAQYEAKITELDGYRKMLDNHYQTMEGLKSKIPEFWDDENARTAAQVLQLQMRHVRNSMDRTDDMLTFYRSAVQKLDGANLNVGSMLQDALGVLGSLGL